MDYTGITDVVSADVPMVVLALGMVAGAVAVGAWMVRLQREVLSMLDDGGLSGKLAAAETNAKASGWSDWSDDGDGLLTRRHVTEGPDGPHIKLEHRRYAPSRDQDD